MTWSRQIIIVPATTESTNSAAKLTVLAAGERSPPATAPTSERACRDGGPGDQDHREGGVEHGGAVAAGAEADDDARAGAHLPQLGAEHDRGHDRRDEAQLDRGGAARAAMTQKRNPPPICRPLPATSPMVLARKGRRPGTGNPVGQRASLGHGRSPRTMPE